MRQRGAWRPPFVIPPLAAARRRFRLAWVQAGLGSKKAEKLGFLLIINNLCETFALVAESLGFGHIGNGFYFVIAGVQFGFCGFKSLQGQIDIFF